MTDQDSHKCKECPEEYKAGGTRGSGIEQMSGGDETDNIFETLLDSGQRRPPKALRNICTAREVRAINLDALIHDTRHGSSHLTFREVKNFPVKRRPILRALSDASEADIDAWFDKSHITIGEAAETEDQRRQAKRLLYTWKDCFATSLLDMKPTDLVQHTIDLKPNARPVYSKIPRYTAKERAFAEVILPEMEKAGIIARIASDWGCRTKFPPQKPGSEDLRVVHNFIPLNEQTIKPQHPMHER